MRRPLLVAAAVAMTISSAAIAGRNDLLARRQASLARTLNEDSLASVMGQRASCAGGQQPASVTRRRSAGFDEAVDATDYCVTLLTRLGRDRRLGYVRDRRNSVLTSALSFDNGFVSGFHQAEALPADLPTMVTLKPVAERCLAQQEADTGLCQSIGYAYGIRAAHGELIIIH